MMHYYLQALVVGCLSILGQLAIAVDRPNVVLILADDLGYGDLSCLNAQSKISTPNIDALARSGIVFTDAHSCSSVCTPTRYALLTGRYSWRSRLKSGVLGGTSPSLIEPEVENLGGLLSKAGYATACVGKWHLGLDWQSMDGQPFHDQIERGSDGWRIDFAKPFRRGPTDLGFDSFFGISASLDMVPYTYLENDRVQVVPTVDKSFPMMHERAPQRSTRPGPAAADFEASRVLPDMIDKSLRLIDDWEIDAKAGKPFFLYLALASPHTPIAPSQEWQRKSGLNPYADFVMQTDAEVGRLLQHLRKLNLDQNTLVIFTSDNGCSPEADLVELAKAGHMPSYHFRGHKADIFEGGHRVPYIASWPRGLPAGGRCDALVGLQDTLATCCDILNIDMAHDTGVDSFTWLPRVTKGNQAWPIRESLVHHSINGSLAIRRGRWKLCMCGDSGGWSTPQPNSKDAAKLPQVQLFDLETDIGERNNLQAQQPLIVRALTDELESLKGSNRSRE